MNPCDGVALSASNSFTTRASAPGDAVSTGASSSADRACSTPRSFCGFGSSCSSQRRAAAELHETRAHGVAQRLVAIHTRPPARRLDRRCTAQHNTFEIARRRRSTGERQQQTDGDGTVGRSAAIRTSREGAGTQQRPERTADRGIQKAVATRRLDPMLIRRAIDNVLENADKYSDADKPIGGWFFHELPDLLEVVISDEGIGLSDSDRAQLFHAVFSAPTRVAHVPPEVRPGLGACHARHYGSRGDDLRAKRGGRWHYEPISVRQGRST